MRVFGAVFGRRGVAGFTGPMLGASRGVVGFNVAMFLCPVREVFRANLPCTGLGCSAALAALLAVGGLHYTKPSRGVSPACRSLCRAIPPIGGGEAATHSGVVPKVQTTSVKNGENGVLWARWSTFWAHRCLARCMCSAHEPLNMRVNPLKRT